MQADSLPWLLECMTLRLRGHAAYDKGDYVSAEQMQDWLRSRSCARRAAKISGT